jgi:hypothetical protein
MPRFSRVLRTVLVPVAALTILVASAVPASASSLPAAPVSSITKPIFKTLGMNW